MVHCCLPVLFFASNNKKGWIVSFLALPSLSDVTHCCFLSLRICQFPLFWSSLFRVSFPCPLSLYASLLFIHPLVPLSLSVTNASRCHTSLLSMACPFICLLSHPPSCASSISLPLLSWCRILISSSLTRRNPGLQLLKSLHMTSMFSFYFSGIDSRLVSIDNTDFWLHVM